eukprot:16129-Eustigmatos_ZCMA.PRE.1
MLEPVYMSSTRLEWACFSRYIYLVASSAHLMGTHILCNLRRSASPRSQLPSTGHMHVPQGA